MLKVGLTGSIAVGKSFVCECLRDLGAHVLDADTTAREVVARGMPGLRAIADAFGDDVIREDGELDREKMASIVFADNEKRAVLNAIVHPLVFEAQAAWLGSIADMEPDSIAVIDAALMIESGNYRNFEKIIVVWCEPEIQLRRLMERNTLTQEAALRRISAQMPQDEKKRYADYLIDTSGGFDSTRRLTAEVFGQLRLLSK